MCIRDRPGELVEGKDPAQVGEAHPVAEIVFQDGFAVETADRKGAEEGRTIAPDGFKGGDIQGQAGGEDTFRVAAAQVAAQLQPDSIWQCHVHRSFHQGFA